MKVIKKVAVGFVLGAAACGYAASAFAGAPVDDGTMQMINGMIMQMQQQTMTSIYAKPPRELTDPVRGGYMQDFSSKLQLMNVIQPVMMEKNVNILKQGFMQQVVDRPIPLPGS